MTKHDIIFLSLAQNCEKDIEKFFSTIADLEKDFKIYSIVGENGSKDFTFDKIIREASKRDYVEIIDTTFIEKFDNRIKRLSIARQN